jgi:hypothetical protein
MTKPFPDDPEWLHVHSHEPNPVTPEAPATLLIETPDGKQHVLHPTHFAYFPYAEVEGTFIVSTGHGASGPFTFGGLPLAELVRRLARHTPWEDSWVHVDVIGADGFGCRIGREELGEGAHGAERPILLATYRDGAPLSRAQGLVRLIVPSETDDALRQVKWVRWIHIHSGAIPNTNAKLANA